MNNFFFMEYFWIVRDVISHLTNNRYVNSKYHGLAEKQTCSDIWLFLESALKLGDLKNIW